MGFTSQECCAFALFSPKANNNPELFRIFAADTRPLIGNTSEYRKLLPNAPIGLWPGLEYEGEEIDKIY